MSNEISYYREIYVSAHSLVRDFIGDSECVKSNVGRWSRVFGDKLNLVRCGLDGRRE